MNAMCVVVKTSGSCTAPGSKLMLTAFPHMLSATGCLVAEVMRKCAGGTWLRYTLNFCY